MNTPENPSQTDVAAPAVPAQQAPAGRTVDPHGSTAPQTSTGARRAPQSPLPPPSLRDRLWLTGLLVVTAALYLWNITVNAMANPFYAGAAWAGTRNWEALLFGSVDPSNFITVDKPPVSQWIMGLSGRLFGFSSMSMLAPQALLGVASVALVYATAARVAGRGAGRVAGAALAITPVATMMFRYNNPDAAMVFFMILGAWCTVRAAQRASGRWLALAGAAMGFAFLAKMLEGLMSLPALVVLYLVAAPTGWGRKVKHLLGAAAALVVSSGWYVLLTILWPAADRPYLAGSTDNSFLNLVFGYNGLARVQGRGQTAGHTGKSGQWADMAGREAGRITAAGEAAMRSGFGGLSSPAGPTRLFTGEFGLEISWLIPAALVCVAAVLVLRRRAPRADLVRAATLMSGLWMVVDGAVLSLMNGTTHAYYSLAIAPAIALCVGLGAASAWERRADRAGRTSLALIVLAAGGWGAWLLLGVAAGWQPWIGWSVLLLTVLGVGGILVSGRRAVWGRRLGGLVATVGLLASLGAPTSIAVNSLGTAHTGGSPSVMPRTTASAGLHRSGSASTAGGAGDWAGRSGAAAMGGFGGMDQQVSNPQLVALLQSSTATWAAATSGTSSAASLELAARRPVMGIGGFTGSDPTPSLASFQADVKAGRIGYYVVTGGSVGTGDRSGRTAGAATGTGSGWGGMGAGTRGGQASVQSQILTWVRSNFPARTVGQATVYTLS